MKARAALAPAVAEIGVLMNVRLVKIDQHMPVALSACQQTRKLFDLASRACKLVGVIRPLLVLAAPGHHSRAGSPDSVDGRRPRACRSARLSVRPGRAARSPGSNASAAPCSCAWPRSH